MRRQIDVVVDAAISSQAHAYAEYRLFAALSHLTGADGVEHALVELRRSGADGEDGVSCTLTLLLNGGGDVCIRTADTHAYGAINLAVERLERMRSAATPAR
jgi:ribosome-associated translation inhibitor RaiA